MTVHNCGILYYTTQHRTVLIIFTLVSQTIITAQMLSVEGEKTSGVTRGRKCGGRGAPDRTIRGVFTQCTV